MSIHHGKSSASNEEVKTKKDEKPGVWQPGLQEKEEPGAQDEKEQGDEKNDASRCGSKRTQARPGQAHDCDEREEDERVKDESGESGVRCAGCSIKDEWSANAQ